MVKHLQIRGGVGMDIWIIVTFTLAASAMSFAAGNQSQIKKLQKRIDELEK